MAKIVLLLGLLVFILQGGAGARRRQLLDSNDTGAPPTVFDVTTFGAKADGEFDNFAPFVKAWKEACDSNVPAKVLIPPGTYLAGQVPFVGPCNNTAPTVEIQGTVVAQTDISKFPSPEWFMFNNIDGLILTGGGTINGGGSSVWKDNDCGTNSGCTMLPSSVKFEGVNNSIIHDITSIDSKGFHFHICDSSNVTAYNLNITAPGDSPNTDGIHVANTDLVNFRNLVIGTGDDCISIGPGTTNATFSDIRCGPGHGLSIGSLGKYENEKDVSGIFINNCTLTNTTNGLRIKTWGGSPPSQATNIHYESITLHQVENPIIIDQHYGSKKNNDPSKVKISDVSFKNVRGSSTSVNAVSLNCSAAVPCDGLQLANIDLTFTGEAEKTALFSSACENAKIVYDGTQNPQPCTTV